MTSIEEQMGGKVIFRLNKLANGYTYSIIACGDTIRDVMKQIDELMDEAEKRMGKLV